MARQMLSTHAAHPSARAVGPSTGHPRVGAGLFSFLSLAVTLALSFSASTLEAALPRGVSGDRAADLILGKPDFSEVNPYTTVAGKLWLPHGVVVDRRNPSGNKLYIYDAGNNRILGFDLNTCRSSPTDPLGCTADIVIGQPNTSTSACNGDSGFQNYPFRAPASASSLCGLQEAQLSISEGGSGASMVVDASGNLYVTDFWNHRVLKYNNPFGTDGMADDVWGQVDFVGNDCNKGMATPDATSLCFTWGDSNNWTAGVDLDASGNLWVVDSGNNRVLRFPAGSKTADLVLGQADFTSSGPGVELNQLWDPSAVRVSPTTGWVYVSESFNNRVLIYQPPFTIGMAGTIFGSDFSSPQGVDFDPTEPGSVWIVNMQHSVIELWSESTKTKLREVGSRDDGNVIGDGSGSIGFDSAGNLYVANGTGEHDNDVLAFDKGAAPNVPTKQFFGKNGNLPTASGLNSGEGVVVSDGQLITADTNRLLFWNNPPLAVNGQPANGYAAGATGFADLKFGCCGIMTADKNHHLWVTGYANADTPVRVDVYQLPLTLGALPIQSLRFPFDVLGGGQILSSSFFSPFTGIAVSDAGELWLGHSATNRVFRLRNPLTAPLVDVILGQQSSAGTECNRSGNLGDAVADSLCLPGHVSFDRLGNLFVSDHSLEIQGNQRLLEFPKNLIPSGNATVIYAPAAAKIFPDSATWQPAFDSHNHMVVGYNPFGLGPNPLGGWFPGIYGDPLSGPATPDAYLLDYHSMAYSAVFDDNDNLYITDLDRSRVLYYDKPTAFLPAIFGFAPLSGPVGSAVVITGTNLINTTAVRFNGISATFTVNSDMQVTATVPAGAMTGPISITTPAGGAGSLVDFVVGSTTLASSLNPATGNATVTFTATVTGSNPTRTVNFTDGGTSISGCAAVALTGGGNTRTAACSTSSLAAGTHSIVANYGGDATNAPSSSVPLSQVIGGSDTTPPVIVPLVSGALGNNGWYTSTVIVNWNVTDPESGIASSSGCTPTTLTADTAGATLTCSATNGVGLSTSVSATVKIDKTPPQIFGMPGAGCMLWPPDNNLIQVAAVSAIDALSGVEPGSFTINGASSEPSDPANPDIVITRYGSQKIAVQLRAARLDTGPGRIYTMNASVRDMAGNTANATARCLVPHDQGG